MPIIQHSVWIDPPTHKNLPVLSELPPGFYEVVRSLGPRISRSQINFEEMHFCDSGCNGWIPGEATEFRVNTLEPEHLAGRRGTEYYCRRCGGHLAFIGIMS